MTDKLAIIGAGGHGKVVADAAISMGKYADIVYVDSKFHDCDTHYDLPIVADDSGIPDLIQKGFAFIIAIGSNRIRAEKYALLGSYTAEMATIIHAAATISPAAKIAPGVVIFAGAIINADASIGANVIVNTAAIVEHDCVISQHVHLAPNSTLTGGCHIGELSLFGASASAIPNQKIGANVVVGAGSVVVHNIPDNTIARGIPAKW